MRRSTIWILGAMCLLTIVLQPVLGQILLQPADWPADPRISPRCSVNSFKLNDYDPHLDGQWQGSKVASDGKVYFFSSTHAGGKDGASFFQYNPLTGVLTEKVSDLSVALGETNAGWNPGQTVPQGKAHSDIVEHNGWLYAQSHLADEARRVDWGGSHVFGYNMATGAIKDLGIPKFRYTGYSGISVDPVRNYLYAFLEPAYMTEYNDTSSASLGPRMYRYDISNPNVVPAPTDIGRLNTGMAVGADVANFYQFTDVSGDTWFTLRNDGGTLYKIPAGGAPGSTIRYTTKLPSVIDPMTGATAGSSVQASRYWGWGQPIGNDKFVFTMSIAAGSGSGGLYLFDAAKFEANQSDPTAFTLLKNIGVTNLGLAYDEGMVYFMRQVLTPGNLNPEVASAQGDANHLMGLNLTTLAVTDFGLVEDQLGRRPWRVESMSADNGKVFFSGDWYLLSNGANPPQPTETGTFRYDPATHLYPQTTRGQIFAVANVPEPAIGLMVLAGVLGLLRRGAH